MSDDEIKLFYQKNNRRYHESHIVGFKRHDYNEFSCIKTVLLHNPRGPAMHRTDNDRIRWYLYGIIHMQTETYCAAANMTEEETFLFMLTYGEELPLKMAEVHPDHNPLLKYTPLIMVEDKLDYE